MSDVVHINTEYIATLWKAKIVWILYKGLITTTHETSSLSNLKAIQAVFVEEELFFCFVFENIFNNFWCKL